MEIAVALEPLADQRRPDDSAVLLDKAPVGLVGHRDLRDPGHRQRIDQTGKRAEQDKEHDRGTQVLEHGRS